MGPEGMSEFTRFVEEIRSAVINEIQKRNCDVDLTQVINEIHKLRSGIDFSTLLEEIQNMDVNVKPGSVDFTEVIEVLEVLAEEVRSHVDFTQVIGENHMVQNVAHRW